MRKYQRTLSLARGRLSVKLRAAFARNRPDGAAVRRRGRPDGAAALGFPAYLQDPGWMDASAQREGATVPPRRCSAVSRAGRPETVLPVSSSSYLDQDVELDLDNDLDIAGLIMW